MTQKNDGFDPTDPIGTWRAIRDANLEAWAKGMSTFTNTETFAKAIGMQLDTMLAASAPYQKIVQQYMETYLAQANMPSRNEVVSLAQRLTNIEMRLDDLQAELDDVLSAARGNAAPAASAPALDDRLNAMQAQLDTILEAVRTTGATNGAAPRRARKTTEE